MKKVTLNGTNLSIDNLALIANNLAYVEVSESAKKVLNDSRQLVFDLVNQNTPVYGFNTGVGWNKDKTIFKDFFQKYNTNLILSHSLGVKPYLSITQARSVMCARLNNLLNGCSGVAPEIALFYAQMLNSKVTPLLPLRGSVGCGDITNLPHIGLTMLGLGKAYYKEELINAKDALQKAGLKPVTLGPKDGLAIASSNAFSAGMASLLVKDTKDFFDTVDLITSISLEGFNGNITPLDKAIYKYRPYRHNLQVAKNMNRNLKGSYIYTSEKLALQDPLSYRDITHIHGSARQILERLENNLIIQLNSSDDNPCLLLNERRIISCANYEPTIWALNIETLAQIFSHMSKSSVFRIIKLSDNSFTGLNRYLSPNNKVHAFAIVPNCAAGVDAEIRHLANPSNSDFFSLAGDIEDHGNNTPHLVSKTAQILDKLYYIFAIELMCACQAIDLRENVALGVKTKKVYEKVRSILPKYNEDRNLTKDIEIIYNLIKTKALLKEEV